MAGSDLAAPLLYTDGRNRRSRWRFALPVAVCVTALFLLFGNRQVGRSGDIEVRACLEPVYSGLFGAGVGAMERCLANRARLFGPDNERWLRYVRHLEASCPISVGMQGQAICEFNVKAKEDRAGKGWRSVDY